MHFAFAFRKLNLKYLFSNIMNLEWRMPMHCFEARLSIEISEEIGSLLLGRCLPAKGASIHVLSSQQHDISNEPSNYRKSSLGNEKLLFITSGKAVR